MSTEYIEVKFSGKGSPYPFPVKAIVHKILDHFKDRNPRMVSDMIIFKVNTKSNCDHILVIYPLSDDSTVRVSAMYINGDPDCDSVELFETKNFSRIDTLLKILEA